MMTDQTRRLAAIDTRQRLHLPLFLHQPLGTNRLLFQGNLRSLARAMFKILTINKDNSVETIEHTRTLETKEMQSLQHLEKCANAARESEMYRQSD